MDINGSKRVFDRLGPPPPTTTSNGSGMVINGSKRVFDRLGPPPPTKIRKMCKHYREGNCARRPCNFLHSEPAPVNGGGGGGLRRTYSGSNSWGKRLCKNWLQGKCTFGDNCRFLHARSTDDQNVVTGIALPSCSKKRYTWSKDDSVNGRDCQAGQHNTGTDREVEELNTCKITDDIDKPVDDQTFEKISKLSEGLTEITNNKALFDSGVLTGAAALSGAGPEPYVPSTEKAQEMQVVVEGGAGLTSGSASIPDGSSAPATDEVLSSPAVNVAQFLTDSSVLIGDPPSVPLDVDDTTAHKEMKIEAISGQAVLQDALSEPNVIIVGTRAVPSPPRQHKKRKTLPAGAGTQPHHDQLQSYGLRPTVKNMCNDWIQGKCTLGDNCMFLHAWFTGDCFKKLTKPEGHQNVVTGIALPSGSDKLYTESKNESVRVLDRQSGQHNTDGEVGKLNTSKIADNVDDRVDDQTFEEISKLSEGGSQIDQEALFSSDVLIGAAASFFALAQKGGNGKKVDGCAGQTSGSASIPVGSSASNSVGSSATTTEEVLSSPAVNVHKKDTPSSEPKVKDNSTPKDGKVDGKEAATKQKVEATNDVVIQPDQKESVQTTLGSVKPKKKVIRKVLRPKVVKKKDTVEAVALPDEKSGIEKDADVEKTAESDEMGVCLLTEKAQDGKEAESKQKVEATNDVVVQPDKKESVQTTPGDVKPKKKVIKKVLKPKVVKKKDTVEAVALPDEKISKSSEGGIQITHKALFDSGVLIGAALSGAGPDPYVPSTEKAQEMQIEVEGGAGFTSCSASIPVGSSAPTTEDVLSRPDFNVTQFLTDASVLIGDSPNVPLDVDATAAHKEMQSEIISSQTVPQDALSEPNVSIVGMRAVPSPPTQHKKRKMCPAGAEFSVLSGEETFGEFVDKFAEVGKQAWNCLQKAKKEISDLKTQNQILRASEYDKLKSLTQLQTDHAKLNDDMKKVEQQNQKLQFDNDQLMKDNQKFQNEVNRLEAEMKIKDDEFAQHYTQCLKVKQTLEDLVAAKSNDVPSNVSTISEVNGHPSLSYVKPCPTEASTLGNAADEQGRFICVRNLGLDANFGQLAKKLKKFGTIKRVGIHIACDNTSKCCFADVEFESAFSAKNAIKASPIKFGGKTVGSLGVIEEKRGTGGTQN